MPLVILFSCRLYSCIRERNNTKMLMAKFYENTW